uniref:Peptidase A2 domain-containing protein n=1 Tax=Micrurus lemniscatus lemniscatus TaxID=129467 RepID=A0A2D4IEP7_MICLE
MHERSQGLRQDIKLSCPSIKDSKQPDERSQPVMNPEIIDSEEDNQEDTTVSSQVLPFLIPVVLGNQQNGMRGRYGALVDTGCTRCLINQLVVDELKLSVEFMKQPMKFEQVDGSLLGGKPSFTMTVPVKLEIGVHWEILRFIVVQDMRADVILGLVLLDHWQPTIWWEGGLDI